jgi:hypothetical protein
MRLCLLFSLVGCCAALLWSGCFHPDNGAGESRSLSVAVSDTTIFAPADLMLEQRRALPYPALARFAHTGAGRDSAITILRHLLWGGAPQENWGPTIEAVERLRCFDRPDDSMYLFRLSHAFCPTLYEVPCRTWALIDAEGRWVQALDAEYVLPLTYTRTAVDSVPVSETLLLAVRREPEPTELLSVNRQGLFNLLDPMSEERPVWFDDRADPCLYDPVLLEYGFEDMDTDGFPDLFARGKKQCGETAESVAYRWRYYPQKRFFVSAER